MLTLSFPRIIALCPKATLFAAIIQLLANTAGLARADQRHEWSRVPVPADPGPGREWRLNEEASDDFNYQFSPTESATVIGGKWDNHYRGNWEGPGTTKWRHENVAVSRGKLWIRATRVPGEKKGFRMDTNGDGKPEPFNLPATRLGCLTSKQKLRHPVYVEANVKIANAVLASNVWMLSLDSTQEIDILEAYGGRGDDNRADWYAKRLHISHHTFIRKPFQDYQPLDDSTWYTRPGLKAKKGKSYWTNRFHRAGVYWRDPTHLEYYIDGKLVKVTSGLDDADGQGGIDPRGYTKDDSGERTGLSKAMNVIINMEAQTWNAAAGRYPTDKELRRVNDHTMLVDWVRVYQPAPKGDGEGSESAWVRTRSRGGASSGGVLTP